MIRVRIAAAAIAAAVGLATPAVAGATDDFTLPFPDPDVSLSYGVDRDGRVGYQLDWTGQLWHDTAAHYGRVYDQHLGIDYPMALKSTVVAARDGTVVDLEEAYGTQQFGDFGNFVLLRHGDGRQTLYYHLAQAGALVALGDKVVAGQQIARSGCSGMCYGAHLHFELRKPLSGGGWEHQDPMALRSWTTWPGRVPYLAAYRSESNAGTEVIRQGATISHWVDFRNAGGRTWLRDITTGRLLLGTWNPAARSSAFRAADWPAAWWPTNLDQASVAPDAIGRFTFGLRASVVPGSYDEAFNLRAYPIFWFSWSDLGGFHVPIVVSNMLE